MSIERAVYQCGVVATGKFPLPQNCPTHGATCRKQVEPALAARMVQVQVCTRPAHDGPCNGLPCRYRLTTMLATADAKVKQLETALREVSDYAGDFEVYGGYLKKIVTRALQK